VTSEKPQSLSQCEVPMKSPAMGEARIQTAERESLCLRTSRARRALLHLPEGNINRRTGNQCGVGRKEAQLEILF